MHAVASAHELTLLIKLLTLALPVAIWKVMPKYSTEINVTKHLRKKKEKRNVTKQQSAFGLSTETSSTRNPWPEQRLDRFLRVASHRRGGFRMQSAAAEAWSSQLWKSFFFCWKITISSFVNPNKETEHGSLQQSSSSSRGKQGHKYDQDNWYSDQVHIAEPQVKITCKHLDSKFSHMRFGGAKIQDPAQVSPHHFLY